MVDRILARSEDVDDLSVFDLSEGGAGRAGDIVLAAFMLFGALAWLATMVFIATMASTPARGRGVAVVLAVGAVPLAWMAMRVWRRARDRDASLQVMRDELVIRCPTILREALHLRRSDVLAVLVDDGAHERFPIVDDPDWVSHESARHIVGHLWTKSVGGMLPLLSIRARVPSCAILFDGARTLPLVRGIAVGQPAPSRRPLPDVQEPGLLMCIGDADRLRAALAGWPTNLAVHRDTVIRAGEPARPTPAPVSDVSHSTPDRLATVQPAALAPRVLTRHQASLRITAAIVGLGVGVLAVSLMCGAFVAAAVSGQVPIVLGGLAAAMGLVLIHVLWPRQRRTRDLGEKVTLDAQPELWRVVQEAASTLDVASPDELRITLWPTISLTQRLESVGSAHTVLSIGLPVIALLGEAQLRVLVATTLDAQRQHAALLINLAWRAQHPVQRALTMRTPTLILSLARRVVYRLLRPIRDELRRSTDALVDAAYRDGEMQVSRHWPTGLLDDAHAAVLTAQEHWDAYWRDVVIPTLAAKEVPALTGGFRAWSATPSDGNRASGLITNIAFIEDRLLS
jgi:hypothetical protein